MSWAQEGILFDDGTWSSRESKLALFIGDFCKSHNRFEAHLTVESSHAYTVGALLGALAGRASVCMLDPDSTHGPLLPLLCQRSK
jgi:hypothetical protein